MTAPKLPPHQQMLEGTVRIFLAEGLMLPTGLLTVAFLTRTLGPETYGIYTLAAAIASWLGWTTTSIYSRSAIKFVSEASDWQTVGSFVLRLSLLAGCGAALLLVLLAPFIADLFDAATLSFYLQLFALEVLFISLSNGHKTILTGLGDFRARSIISSGHWLLRLVLIVLFVELGFSLAGAVLGSVVASFLELLISRFFIRPSLCVQGSFPLRRFWSYSLPLFLFVISMRLFDKLDLFALKMLGGAAADVGIYAAAQNLTLVPGIFAVSFSTPLLTIMTRMLHSGLQQEARDLASGAMRVVVLMLPFAGVCAGAAPEIVQFIFGPAFIPAARLLVVLIFASIALVMISIVAAILTAAGKPSWTISLTAPILPVSVLGYWLTIPRMGPLGAAWVTTVVAFVTCLAAMYLIFQLLRISVSPATILCSIVVCVGANVLASAWPAVGIWLLVKLSILCVAVCGVYLLIGELNLRDVALLRAAFGFQTSTKHNPGE